ncbi:imm11 family protein [Archangium primigenium]|uniref:imm11 family protein n=1 Tax=[Archangium] primigenium TaxID=2792470 RepID=UPI00195F23F6|nr:DUF1629 domain-containing protein [Archangium primigenium]MBM7112306.1 suppressor of fused domain protein [Archangium primigenium]
MNPPSRFFILRDDVEAPGRWDLGTPVDGRGHEWDDAAFRKGAPVSVEGPLRIPLRAHDGTALDYTEAGLGVPLVSAKAAAVFSALAPHDIQLIPVSVEAHPEPFFILVSTRVEKCIDDEQSSSVEYWKPEDGRPDRTGRYRSVQGLRIDPTKVGDARVFRTWGWVNLLVSEHVKQALEDTGATGLRFEEVTGPSDLSAEEKAWARAARARRERVDRARDAFWRTLGTLDTDTIPLVGFGPWPSHRQIWRVIRRPNGHTLIVTDGLSDYFLDSTEDSVGFGLELSLETDATFPRLYTSWPTLLLQRVSTELAEHAPVRERALIGLCLVEVPGKDMPKALRSAEGTVGVVLGLPTPALPDCFTLPAGLVKLVTVKALLASELLWLRSRGEDGLALLATRLQHEPSPHLSQARRPALTP